MSDILDQAIESYYGKTSHPVRYRRYYVRSGRQWPHLLLPNRVPQPQFVCLLETSPLKTVTVVSAPPRPPKDLCLSNLYQIEQDYGPLSNE